MKQKQFLNIREYMFWIYSNIAMAHVALKNSHQTYERTDYMIRAKLYKGLCEGTMSIASIYDDEKYKLNNPLCCYCGCTENLSIDHLIPRFCGGGDSGENLVYACRKCNSSKNRKDLIEWYVQKNSFPPILVLRRYIKLAILYYEEENILELSLDQLSKHTGVFKIDLLPYRFPQPEDLRL